MAKRFTDTEKWKDEWYIALDKDGKLIWTYLCDNCTNAGRWKKSFKHLNFCCDTEIDNAKLLKFLDGRIVDKGSYVFIPKFLTFQYPGGLNSQKRAIVAVVKELTTYGLLETVNKLFGNEFLSISNQSVINQGLKQDTDKDKDKETDKYTEPFQYFCLTYQKTFGKEYIASFAKDKKLIKDLLGIIPENELRELMDRFFISDDEFIKKSGYSIGVFKSQVNKLRALNKKSTLIFKKE